MIYRIVDSSGETLAEYNHYNEAAERLNDINDQSGPIAHLEFHDK